MPAAAGFLAFGLIKESFDTAEFGKIYFLKLFAVEEG